MAGELADEVGVFDFLVEVADEGAACHMGAGDIADGVLLGLLGAGVDDGDDAVYSGLLEGFADEAVERAGGVVGEDGPFGLAVVAAEDFEGGGGEVDFDYSLAFVFGLGGDVVDGGAFVRGDDVLGGEGEEVAYAAADVALEYEDVAGCGDVLVAAEVGSVEGVAFFGGEVVGCAEFLGAYGVFAEGVVAGVAHIYAPAPVGADGGHIGDDGVVAAFFGCSFVGNAVPDVLVFADGLKGVEGFLFGRLEEGVFAAEEFFDGGEGVGCRLVEVDGPAGVEFVAADDVEDGRVGLLAGGGDFLVFEEFVEFVEEVDFVAFGLAVVLGVEEAVDGVLRPVLREVGDGLVVAFFEDVADDAVNLGFGFLGFAHFGGDDAVLDDDFSAGEEFGEDVGACVGAEGDFAGVAVAQEDFGLAGVLARAG